MSLLKEKKTCLGFSGGGFPRESYSLTTLKMIDILSIAMHPVRIGQVVCGDHQNDSERWQFPGR